MTVTEMRRLLAGRETTSRRLCEGSLARAQDPDGEGRATFTILFPEEALAAADAWDSMRAAGIDLPPLAGIPISVKDLFDVKGYPTRAGAALVRDDASPAAADAVVVARLRAAGAVIVGKTNMTEFAYSGLGINPHYGTPRNPFDRAAGRIPGGSSSGAAVSVTDAMAAAAIGSDTGGSVRIPAALCGLVGFKPTAARIPRAGTFPLSDSFDSIGPLTQSVDDAILLDAVLSGDGPRAIERVAIADLHFAVPESFVFDDVDPDVGAAFSRALDLLARAGARVSNVSLSVLDRYVEEAHSTRQLAAQAYWLHAGELEQWPQRFDPRVGSRIRLGKDVTAADYIGRVAWRAQFVTDFAQALAGFDALLWPTVPVIAPLLQPLVAGDEAYTDANRLLLRNTSVVNVADGCAITLPMHEAGRAPAGLQLAAAHGSDHALLAAARACMAALTVT